MNPPCRIARPLFLLGLAGVMTPLAAVPAEPRRPQSDAEIVAILRPGATPAADRELRHLRQRAADPAADEALAIATARRCLQRHRETADPRFLGAAMASLGTAWSRESAEPELRVLRATIRQSLHEFDAAEGELAAALARDPRHVPAWLLLANIQCVRGQWDAARRSALQLARMADPLTATTLVAQIASLTGKAGPARSLLDPALAREASASGPSDPERDAVRRWARSVLAETLDRHGDTEGADRTYREALAGGASDPHLLGAYADFLLDHGRAGEVPSLLRGWESVDALALRVAEANRDPRLMARLGLRFDEARAAGERLHLREAARFALRLRGDPQAALPLALENWKVQREPADFRLLAESAVATRNATAIAEAASWLQQHPIEGLPPTLESSLRSAARRLMP